MPDPLSIPPWCPTVVRSTFPSTLAIGTRRSPLIVERGSEVAGRDPRRGSVLAGDLVLERVDGVACGIGSIADRILDLSGRFLGLAFVLQVLVVGEVAGCLLHSADRLVCFSTHEDLLLVKPATEAGTCLMKIGVPDG